MQQVVEILLAALAVYLALGVAFAALFHVKGMARVDPAVRGAGFLFRALVTPGIVALWPSLARSWIRAGAEPGEGTAPARPSAVVLRRTHRLLAQALAVLVPIGVGIGIGLRPAAGVGVAAPLSEPGALPQVLAEASRPFPVLPIEVRLRGDDAGQRQLELGLDRDLEIPAVFAFLSPGGGDASLRGAILLGSVWGPGNRRFDLPVGIEPGTTLVLYSLGRDERVGSFALTVWETVRADGSLDSVPSHEPVPDF